MIQVLLASPDDAFADRLTAAIGSNFRRLASPLPADAGALFAADGSRPHIVVLDSQGRDDQALDLASQLQQAGVATILVSDRAAELALPALRAGVRDLLTPDAPASEVRLVLDRTASALSPGVATAPQPSPGPVEGAEGRVIAVISPKGGVGKTTIASNLAVGLAGKRAQSTVLVDLDVHFGDVASALNLEPEHTLPDIARGPASRDTIAVKSYLTEHATGLYVVPGSESPAAADTVTAEDLRRLLQLLRTQFEYVVVDTAPGLSEHTLAVLDEANTLVMVTSLDVPGIRGLRKEIDTLSELHLMSGARYVVLNFADASRGLSVADVEATIRSKVDVVIPTSPGIPLSVNQGIPLMQTAGRDAITQKLRTLVELVAPSAPDAPRRGLFARRARA